MRKWWVRLIHDKRGSMYLDTAVFVFVACMSLALTISVLAVSWRKTSAQDIADYAARQISADGAFSGSTIQKLTTVAGSGHFLIEVKSESGLDVSVPVSSSETGYALQEIQQGTGFSVTITSTDQNVIGVGGVQTNNTSVYGAANGVSARYWKG